ncbi:Arc family DNA-binding protein [Stenotrophomonas maltophilia]|nr:Arc family DNA-binding protein [Stenotrophomonas maltophilia]
MARDITPFPLRLPADLRDRLEQFAKMEARSLNAEIVSRLEASFPTVEMEIYRTRGEEVNKLDFAIQMAEEVLAACAVRLESDNLTASEREALEMDKAREESRLLKLKGLQDRLFYDMDFITGDQRFTKSGKPWIADDK